MNVVAMRLRQIEMIKCKTVMTFKGETMTITSHYRLPEISRKLRHAYLWLVHEIEETRALGDSANGLDNVTFYRNEVDAYLDDLRMATEELSIITAPCLPPSVPPKRKRHLRVVK